MKRAKAKKNDVIIACETSSYTHLHGSRVTTDRFYWARALQVDRLGKVKTYVRADGTRGDQHAFVYVISDPDKQGAAREMFGTEPTLVAFESVEPIRAMILDRVGNLK
jgi:hypothetical protein